MDIFAALAVSTRRDIVEMLADKGQLSATDIAKRFPISAPAISQHLKILREAKLVDMEKSAQQRLYSVNPRSILELEKWARQMTRVWNDRFDRLDVVLAQHKHSATRRKDG